VHLGAFAGDEFRQRREISLVSHFSI